MSIKETAEIRPEHRPFIDMGHKIRAKLEPGSGVDWDDEEFNKAAELSTQLIKVGTNFGPKNPAEAVKNAGLDVEGFKAIVAKVNGKKESVAEGLADMAGMAERDHEVQMARAELYKIAKYAIKLHEMLKGVSEAEGIEGWMQSKITKAADYIGSVYHTLDYDMATESKKTFKSTMSEAEATSYKADLKSKLDEKAKSKAQQRFMGMVHAAQKGEEPASPEVAKVAKSMKKKDALDFAKTKHKGKPEHVKKKK